MSASSRQPVADACRHVLEHGDLASKLAPLPASAAAPPASPLLSVERPARGGDIAFAATSEALPRPRALADPGNGMGRARCLARFAHHELMAVELFAWALLRWPEVPMGLRRDWLHILGEEQLHCRLYVERLAALDATLADFPCSDYLWRHCAAVETPRSFLAAMGLTLEQANLDFSLRYAGAFRDAGDERSARVLERVHEDEIRHVSRAAQWLRSLDREGPDDVARYERAIVFPLSAARAKARPFRADARRRAGLEEPFIEYVRRARSSQERAGKSR